VKILRVGQKMPFFAKFSHFLAQNFLCGGGGSRLRIFSGGGAQWDNFHIFVQIRKKIQIHEI
jgi:hypothetical protein